MNLHIDFHIFMKYANKIFRLSSSMLIEFWIFYKALSMEAKMDQRIHFVRYKVWWKVENSCSILEERWTIEYTYFRKIWGSNILYYINKTLECWKINFWCLILIFWIWYVHCIYTRLVWAGIDTINYITFITVQF